MSSFLVIIKGFTYGLHIIVCIVMILAILLQAGKSAGIGSALGGGGSQTLFGAGGGQGFLAKFTTAAAIIFMFTSIGLAKLSTPSEGGFEKKVEEQKAQLAEGKGEEVDLEDLGVSQMPESEETEALVEEASEKEAIEEALLEEAGEEEAIEEAGEEEGATGEPAEEPAVEPAKKPVAEPAEKPAKKPVAEPAEKPAKKPVAEPAEKPAEEPAE